MISSGYYTNVFKRGNSLYVREVINGKREYNTVEFAPTIWTTNKPVDTTETWHDMYGKELYPKKLSTMGEFYSYQKDFSNVTVHSAPGHIYQYINEYYPENIDWKISDIRIFTIDIETEVGDDGFHEPDLANERIQLITVKDFNSNKFITFGLHPYTNTNENVIYIHEPNELSLLRRFIAFWTKFYPDVVTGWNSHFDTVYLYNRISKLLGVNIANKLSPYDVVTVRDKTIGKKVYKVVDIGGISHLDYLVLYKKFTYNSQESYTLDYISSVELGESKVDNPYDTFKDFYQKDFQLFVDYNIQDVALVEKLENKLKFIELALTIAYSAKILYEDVFSPIKTWDVIIYNYLYNKKMVIPNKDPNNIKTRKYGGGYVKPPLIGRHDWVVSLDVTSLYPSLIMAYQVSPEKITNITLPVTINGLLEEQYDLSKIYNQDLCMAANGCCFTKGDKGILPSLIQFYFDKRKEAKGELKIVKKELEELKKIINPSIDEQKLLEEKTNIAAKLNGKQMAVKILINSLYGALGSDNFRYFDLRMAEGITFSGQLTIQWVANRLNAFINKLCNTSNIDRIPLIDTDSIIINLSDFINKYIPNETTENKIKYLDKLTEDKIRPFIGTCVEELLSYTNAYENKIYFARENIVDTMISCAAKSYVMSIYNSDGIQYTKPKLKIMGLSMIKSSTPKIVRQKLKDSLDIILYSNESKIQEFISEYKKEFMKLPLLDIAFPRGVSDITKYADSNTIYKPGQCVKANGKVINTGTPINVRGSLLYNHYLRKYKLLGKYPEIKNGDKIKYVHLKLPNYINEDMIAFPAKLPKEFKLDRFVDYDLMFEKSFIASIESLLNALNWTVEPQNTLF